MLVLTVCQQALERFSTTREQYGVRYGQIHFIFDGKEKITDLYVPRGIGIDFQIYHPLWRKYRP